MDLNEVRSSYNQYLNSLINGCQIIADYIRDGDIATSLKLVQQFAEGLTWLANVNEKLEILTNEKNDLQINTIEEYMLEINRALEIQDFTVVADLFEYEIKPFFENCSHYTIN